jgi:Flp pilus assembly protein TadG
MKRRLVSLKRDTRGAALVEMALTLPVLSAMIYGIFTFGQLFQANAGMQHALGEGSRYATLCLSISGGACTVPSDTQIVTRVNAKLFGTGVGTFDAPLVDSTTVTSGYKTITVTYHQPMNFLVFMGPTVDLTRSKRVYIAP